MSTHTPTPWKTDCNDVIGPGNKKIATPVREWADAVHIVRCVNSHDALLAACKEAEPVFADAVSACIAARIPGWQKLPDVRDKLRDAIKLAEGQG